MKDFIDTLSKETGFKFYFIEREEGASNCVVYNHTSKGIISDGTKELTSYNMYFLLVVSGSVSKNIKILEDALYKYRCLDISVKNTLKTEDKLFQTAITFKKII